MQNLFDEITGPGIYDESPVIPTKRQGVCGCPKCRQKREMNSFSDESILDEILNDEAGWNEYEWEVSSRNAISSEDYIKWVQRSINRILGTNLNVNGIISNDYRKALRQFNKIYLNGRSFDDIDERTQNQMIKVNEMTPQYMAWVQEALLLANGGKIDIIITGKKDSNTKRLIKSFQRKNNLIQDGFVGSKTELALIKASRIFPPGSRTPTPTPPQPRPTIEPLNDKEITQFVWAIIGETPKVKNPLLEFYKIAGAPPYSMKTFFKVFFKALIVQFKDKPKQELKVLMGAIYALMDEATGFKRNAIQNNARRKGYHYMKKRLVELKNIPEISKKHQSTLSRLKAVKSKPRALRVMFNALLPIYKSKGNTQGRAIWANVAKGCSFLYPSMRSAGCGTVV